MYQIRYARAALKGLKRLPPKLVPAVMRRIEALCTDPRPDDCKKLKGYKDVYRIRQGDYRVIYQVLDGELKIIIVDVGDRKYVYRKY